MNDERRAVGTRTYTEAALEVLRAESDGRPMHYREITRRAIANGWIRTTGLTPEASMGAALSQAIKRAAQRDEVSAFKAYGRGLYGLARAHDSMASAIELHNGEVREKLRSALRDLAPAAFEVLIGRLLEAIGFQDVEVTKRSGDHGIDVRGRLSVGGVTSVSTAIQVKRWANPVSGEIVQRLRGSLGPHERGLVITLSRFTKDAEREASLADRTPISLLSGDNLLGLLIEHDIGVTRKRVSVLDFDAAALELADDDDEARIYQVEVGTPGTRTSAAGKSLAVWPLPGGNDSWKKTLDRMLGFVSGREPTLAEAAAWLQETYPRVRSAEVTRSYWRVPRSLGLINLTGEHLELSATGARYAATGFAETTLLDVLRDNVAGIDLMLRRLSSGPATSAELLAALRDEVGVQWETTVQVDYRLGWLEQVRAIERRGSLWCRSQTVANAAG